MSGRRARSLVEGLAVFLLGVVVMHMLYAGSVEEPGDEIGAPGHDSFYHVAMASMLSEHGAMAEFPWLEYVYFRDEGRAFVSHHWGFHLLLFPFVKTAEWLKGDALAGGRWAITAVFGANLLLFHLLLRQRRVPLHWLWIALFFLLPDQFYARHAFVRAIGPSFLFMQLILLALFARRYWLGALAVGAYVHLYLGAVMFGPLLVAIYAAAQLVTRSDDRRVAVRMVLITAVGWAIGVLTYPYAGGMFEFLRLQVFGTGLSPDIEVGREWKAYTDAWFLITMSAPLLVTWGAALYLRLRLGPRLGAEEATVFVLQLAFLVLTFKARRFIEYWPPMCLLSAAYMASPPLAEITASVRAWLGSRPAAARPYVRAVAGLLMVLTPVATFAAGTKPLSSVSDQLRCYYDLDEIRAMMAVVEASSEPGDIIFTDDWDIFPVFFYLNRYNHYIVGLDPKFTHQREPDLWNRFVRISRGEVPSTISLAGATDASERAPVTLEDIREAFHARFVIADRDHRPLADALAAAPQLAEPIYPSDHYEAARDAAYVVFHILDEDETPVRDRPAAKQGPLALSTLTPALVSQGWGDLRADRSVEGNTIRLDGRAYGHGVGTHAPSRLLYDIPAGYSMFEARVGVDDETGGRGSVVVSVRLDGRTVYESPRLGGGQPPAVVRISIDGARQLQLEANPTLDGQRHDHVSWAEARLVPSATD